MDSPKQRAIEAKIKCPICKGEGRLTKPWQAPGKQGELANKAVMAKLLHNEGYGLRAIAQFLGYKSSRSAALLLKRKKSQ